MKLSLLVPTLGTREFELDRLIKSLKNQTYRDFEVVVVSQICHDTVVNVIKKYPELDIEHIKTDKKGLSLSRNIGLGHVKGDIVILSDDDCWYPNNALAIIAQQFDFDKKITLLLSQIKDYHHGCLYKNYSSEEGFIKNKIQLLSRSSIEIAFKKGCMNRCSFDERFGLGAEFVCGEEVDFLIANFKFGAYKYIPKVTVYHDKKEGHDSVKQVEAKGAFYGKNFNVFICLAVLLRDFFKKGENNFVPFIKGYRNYKGV